MFLRVLAVVALAAFASALNPNEIATLPGSGFSVYRTIPGGSGTAQGITFTPNGDLYMSVGGCLYHYPGAVNLPTGQTLTPAPCIPFPVDLTNIVSSQNGNLYSYGGYQLFPATGTVAQRWTNCGATHGIAVDPRNGNIYTGSINGPIFFVPNPDTHPGLIANPCAPYYNAQSDANPTGVDGITIGPDGTLYAAGYQADELLIISADDGSHVGHLVAEISTNNRGVDGVSICIGSGNSFALVSGEGFSTITRFNLTGTGGAPVYGEVPVANNVGGYLDFTTVDPKGCIWGTDFSYGAYRVTNDDGTCGCASAQVPTGGTSCPNCADVTAVTGVSYEQAFTQSASSSGVCASMTFA